MKCHILFLKMYGFFGLVSILFYFQGIIFCYLPGPAETGWEMVSRAGRESSSFRAPSVQSSAGRWRLRRWSRASLVQCYAGLDNTEEEEAGGEGGGEEEEEEGKRSGGMQGASSTLRAGDILLICLNCCCGYHGTSSGRQCAVGSLGRGSDLHSGPQGRTGQGACREHSFLLEQRSRPWLLVCVFFSSSIQDIVFLVCSSRAASKTLRVLLEDPRRYLSCVFFSSIQDIAFLVCSRWSQELMT